MPVDFPSRLFDGPLFALVIPAESKIQPSFVWMIHPTVMDKTLDGGEMFKLEPSIHQTCGLVVIALLIMFR